jgi:hypothetical protein
VSRASLDKERQANDARLTIVRSDATAGRSAILRKCLCHITSPLEYLAPSCNGSGVAPDFRLLFEEGDGGQLFEAGASVFKQGTTAPLHGRRRPGEVEGSRDGRSLYVMREGSLAGEMALISHAPRSAGAIARTQCGSYPWTSTNFIVAQQTPLFALEAMRRLVERVRYMNDKSWL